ncbi:MAG: carboxypeptidase-like regulatory domain-containing protein [Flavobacteriaceae bacterium]|nr:carboxypeptidase-like regulatory domain-containing protein [Flavobacteriaceae bacterium]
MIVAQKLVKGSVYFDSKPLEGASVYLNNTMLGTTTNEKGEFTITVNKGNYELIVSYLGFETMVYNLNIAEYKNPLRFNMQESRNQLDEIVVKKIVYDDEWKYNLEVFKKEFLGASELAKDCKILNKEVLGFNFDAKKNKLEAFARKPIEIKHNKLGYLIKFDLISFERSGNQVSYLGYTRYAPLKGGKRKQRRWKKNRLTAYKGSPVHFFKSLMNKNLVKEGFVVNQFRRELNPDRPSEEEIKNARELLKLNNNFSVIDLSNKKPKNYTALDSAMAVLRKVRLPKYKDYLYKSQLKEKEIVTAQKNLFKLVFKDNLLVVYKGEKEEVGYLKMNPFSKKLREPTFQTSNMIPLVKDIYFDKNGSLTNPLALFYEGYWSYEKFSHSLPLDYKPEE